LKQFVEQYDNALKDKIEKESIADFGSFNRETACVSLFGFESQFQKAFTNAKFKEFQLEIASMMYCNACFKKLEGLDSKRKISKVDQIVKKLAQKKTKKCNRKTKQFQDEEKVIMNFIIFIDIIL